MEQNIMLNETLQKVTNYKEAQKIKRVWFGGYQPQAVEELFQHVNSMYVEDIENLGYEKDQILIQQQRKILQLEEKLKRLQDQNTSLEFQLKATERKYDRDLDKINGMKEQLGETLLKIASERKTILNKARKKHNEILEQAKTEADLIVKEKTEAFYNMIEQRYRELEELQSVQKSGLELMTTMQDEVSQLSFKVDHIKRQLANNVHTTNLIHFDKKESSGRRLKMVK